ncbi:MAG TPA: hypothetical protein VFH90_06330 [Candidatus Limnocylindria bacterium]|nr:hypothetical protein [Candidatus Limnocylindria bacterium]
MDGGEGGVPQPTLGSCAGYEVRSSNVGFRTLRSGGGEPMLVHGGDDPQIGGEVVATWRPRPGNPFHGRLLQDGGIFHFWASDVGWYTIDAQHRTITISGDVDMLQTELRLFGIPAAICAFESGDAPLHASAIEIDGQAIILAGPSRQGKTTLAAAFAAHGHRLLSEDTTRCVPGRVPSAFPGPAVVRLRSDVAGLLDIPTATALPTSFEDGRTAFLFDDASRGSGAALPLRAILMLRPGEGPPTLRSVDSARAARDLFSLAFRLPTDASRAACFARVVDLAGRVEVMDLHRPITIDSLPSVISLVERHLEGGA